MEAALNIDVAQLDAPHRRALEEVIGQELAAHQRLVISVIELAPEPGDNARPAQSLDDWAKVYEGLSENEVEAVDAAVKTRAHLTRHLP